MKFNDGKWQHHIDVRDFIVCNYTPYDGDESFLADTTERTAMLWEKVKVLMEKERNNGGVLDIDEHTISTITAHKPGYIDKELEDIADRLALKKSYYAIWRYQNGKVLP